MRVYDSWNFKKSSIALLLASLSCSSFAAIHERPWQDKIYNEFVTWDYEIQRFGTCPNCQGGSKDTPVQNFYFNEGAEISIKEETGTGNALYVGAGFETVDLSVNLGNGKNFTLIGHDASLKVGKNSKASILGQNTNLLFGAANWDTYNSEATIYLEENSSFFVEGGNLSVNHGAETNLKLFDNAKANIQLTGNFQSYDGGTGIAIQNNYANSDTTLEIKASNISLSTTDRKDAARKAGLYLLAYDNAGDSRISTKFTADNLITISGFNKGIQTFGSSDIDLTAKNIVIAGQSDSAKSYGIYLDGYNSPIPQDKTVTSQVTLNGKESVTVQGSYVATRLQDRAAVDVNSDSVIIQSGYMGAWLEAKSALNINSKLVSLSGNNWAIYSVNSSTNIDSEQTGILGKVDLRKQSSFTLNATSQINAIGGFIAMEGSSIAIDSIGTSNLAGGNSPLVNVLSAEDKNSRIDLKLNKANISGRIKAFREGVINLKASEVAEIFSQTVLDETGVINLALNKDSAWYLTGNSSLTSLTLNGSTVDFYGWTSGNASTGYRSLNAKTLEGKDNKFKMHIDLANETEKDVLTDQFNVTGKALGTHTADLKIDGKDLVPEKFHSENWLISQGADSNMSILNKEGKNQYSGRGMVTTWGLAFVANGEEDKLNTAEGLAQLVGNTTGKGEGKWYLVRNDEEIVDPNPNPGPDPKPDPKPEQPKPNDPAEMQQITNLGISATQALSFASELEDLRSRLGEVRYGAQDGAWVRAGYTKETADGYNGRGFEQKTHDLHIGLDRIVAADEDSSWLVGGALRYAKSKQEGFTAARGGEGELEQYSAKLYATYMHAQGSYADFVVQAGRYSQDLTGLANDLSSAFKADYKTYGYGASVEIGHMFDFNNQVDDRQWFNHFFIEPQLQLSYFNAHGKDYKTSTGLAVSQSDADFLTGRAGVVLGKKFNYGTADDLDKRYFQVGLKGGVKYEFLGDQTIRFTGVERVTKERQADDVDGARYYYGVTADWQLSHNFRAYATVEREEGDHYTKDFDVSVGVKYQF